MKPPIFIVGLPRTGSTLWSNVIGSHPDITKFTEVHLLSPWHRDFRYTLKNKVGDLSQKNNITRLIEVMFSRDHKIDPTNTIWWWRQIRSLEKKGLKEALYKRIIASEDRDIGSIFKILIEEATRCQGSNRAVVKFPVYPAYLGELIKWWRNSRSRRRQEKPRFRVSI